jgi:hypothetical protein
MIKRTVCVASFTFAFLILLSANLAAQNKHLAPRIAAARPSGVVVPAQAPVDGMTKIYSNLGSRTDTYDDSVGYALSGPDNFHQNGRAYMAVPFTPAVDSTAKAVLIALSYNGEGTDAAVVGIFSDANGLPGKPLKLWGTGNFPVFGTCCKLVVLQDATGVPLTGGTQYWIAAGTGAKSKAAIYEWDFTWNDSSGTVAFLNGFTDDQWLADYDNLTAFAVYGTTP